jgi:hypothetical protein
MIVYLSRERKTMRIEGKKVILKPDEVVDDPIDPRWAAHQIQVYGLEGNFKGRLARLSRSPAVLRLAGYEVEIEQPKTEQHRGGKYDNS